MHDNRDLDASFGLTPGAEIDWWTMLGDPTFLADPYPWLERVRERGGVQFDPQSGVFFVLSHKAFSTIMKSPALGRDTRHWTQGWTHPDYRDAVPVGFELFSSFQPQMINSNPPEHGRMRGVYEPAFRSQAVTRLTEMVQAEADRLLDRLPTDGSTVNLIEAYAAPMPLRVLCNLFEVPEAMDDEIGRWSASLIRIGDIMLSAEQKVEALDALREFKDFLRAYIAERGDRTKDQAGDGLMDLAISAFRDGTLDEEETLTNLVSMLVAGHETTVTLIGNGLMLLQRYPDQRERLVEDASLDRTAIEEFMRFEPGGNMVLRVAVEDVEIDGVRISGGSPVIGLIGACNRDPERFADPQVFDVGRRPNTHLTFGGGAQICICAPLARLEERIALRSLLDRFPNFEPAGEPVWRLDRMNARGLSNLPVWLGPPRSGVGGL